MPPRPLGRREPSGNLLGSLSSAGCSCLTVFLDQVPPTNCCPGGVTMAQAKNKFREEFRKLHLCITQQKQHLPVAANRCESEDMLECWHPGGTSSSLFGESLTFRLGVWPVVRALIGFQPSRVRDVRRTPHTTGTRCSQARRRRTSGAASRGVPSACAPAPACVLTMVVVRYKDLRGRSGFLGAECL